MKIKVAFWYPSALKDSVPEEIDVEDLTKWIFFFNGMGLNVLIPQDLFRTMTIYVDTKRFTQR